jgi:hypothetical protein
LIGQPSWRRSSKAGNEANAAALTIVALLLPRGETTIYIGKLVAHGVDKVMDCPVLCSGGQQVMDLERAVANLIEKVEHRFYGKYRGIVVDNHDPAKLGRLNLHIPSVFGVDATTGWAMPCTPYGGKTGQGFLFIPDVGAGVWVEFEEGKLEFPIWVGTYWRNGDEQPKPDRAADGSERSAIQDPSSAKIIKTSKGHTIQFEDADGAEMLLIREGKSGHFITMDDNGINITDASGNRIEFRAAGIRITDANGNMIEMSDSAFTLTANVPFKIDASGQPVTIVASAIDHQQG